MNNETGIKSDDFSWLGDFLQGSAAPTNATSARVIPKIAPPPESFVKVKKTQSVKTAQTQAHAITPPKTITPLKKDSTTQTDQTSPGEAPGSKITPPCMSALPAEIIMRNRAKIIAHCRSYMTAHGSVNLFVEQCIRDLGALSQTQMESVREACDVGGILVKSDHVGGRTPGYCTDIEDTVAELNMSERQKDIVAHALYTFHEVAEQLNHFRVLIPRLEKRIADRRCELQSSLRGQSQDYKERWLQGALQRLNQELAEAKAAYASIK